MSQFCKQIKCLYFYFYTHIYTHSLFNGKCITMALYYTNFYFLLSLTTTSRSLSNFWFKLSDKKMSTFFPGKFFISTSHEPSLGSCGLPNKLGQIGSAKQMNIQIFEAWGYKIRTVLRESHKIINSKKTTYHFFYLSKNYYI